MALLGSGALAGLAGGVEVSGVSYALFQNLSPGYGFTGIAVALLARLHPLGVVATGLLFGALEAGAGAMQRDAGVPAVAVYVVEAVVIVVVLLADGGDAPGDARPRVARERTRGADRRVSRGRGAGGDAAAAGRDRARRSTERAGVINLGSRA